MSLEIDVVTLFPDMVEAPLRASIPGRILESGLATLAVHDLRRWGLGRHRSVDDATYGGGAGMVLRPEPVAGALGELRRADSTVVLLDPAGEVFRQARAADLARRPHLVFVCPRYEGVDERIRAVVDLELSIGDYVLTGGELPALVVIDAVLRLLPGAIDADSTAEEIICRRPARIPAVHTPRRIRRARRAADPRVRPPRTGSALATQGRAAADARPPPGPVGGSIDVGRRTPAARGDRPGGWADERRRSRRPPRWCARRGAPALTPALTRQIDRAILRRRPIWPPARPPIAAPLPNHDKDSPVNVLDEIVADQLKTDLPELASGDTVRVSAKVVEGNRERIQVFEGIVMRLRGGGISRSITVRRIASGVGVERTFKIHSPRIEKIDVVRHGQVRRAQLYFLRKRIGKAATLRERR